MSVEYPQVIAAIKQWLDKNKMQVDQSVIISGQPAGRKANLTELLIAAAGSTIGSLTGGSTLPGDTVNPDGSIVKGALSSAISGIGKQVSDFVGSVGSNIDDALGNVGSYVYVNPVAFDEARFTSIVEIYATVDDPALADAAADVILKSQPAGLWNQAVSAYNSFTNGLTGVTIPATDGFTLKDAFTAATDKTNAFLSQITDIQKFDVIDLAGSIAKPALMEAYDTKHAELEAIAATPAVTPEEIADKNQAILDKTAEVDAAVAALTAQMESDKAAYAAYIAQQNALETVMKAGIDSHEINNNPDLTDEHKALYASTLNPDTAANASNISSVVADQQAAALPPTVTV